jgi:hypothetical protein
MIMKKNYVVIKQFFYKKYDGRDISMPIDANDVQTFSSKEKALDFIANATKYEKIPFVECKQELFYSRSKATSYAQQSYEGDVRRAFLFVESCINEMC